MEYNFWYVQKPLSENINRIVIDFIDLNSLEKLKETIVVLTESEDLDIVVNDYLENTDLDIWIQLIGKRASTPRYYPISKKIGKCLNL